MANAVASRLVAPPAVPPWAPLLSLLVCLGVVWTAVAPLGAPRIWEAAGAAAALGGLGGIALQYFLRRRITVQLPMLVAIGIGLWRGGAAVSDGEAPWIVPAQRVRVFATIDAPVETRGTTASLYAHIDRVIDPSGAQA